LRNQSWISSFEERERGTTIGVTDEHGAHGIQWEGSWRDVSPLDRPISGRDIYTSTYSGPSRTILESCIPSVKSSLRYTFTHDRRDHPTAPSRGHYFQWLNELAGVGGDAKYAKTEATAQYYRPLTPSFVIMP
jgi:outer membrane protein assembly factor BamA